jgi:hypothetical protein
MKDEFLLAQAAIGEFILYPSAFILMNSSFRFPPLLLNVGRKQRPRAACDAIPRADS